MRFREKDIINQKKKDEQECRKVYSACIYKQKLGD